MKNKCYFFFPPMQYIAIDAAIPLVVTLAKKGWKVYSVFYSLHIEEQYYTQTYLDFIKEHSKNNYKLSKSHNICDTYLLSKMVLFSNEEQSRESVSEFYDLSIEGSHRATNDASNSGKILIRLISELLEFDSVALSRIHDLFNDREIPNRIIIDGLFEHEQNSSKTHKNLETTVPIINYQSKQNNQLPNVEDVLGANGSLYKNSDYEYREFQYKMAQNIEENIEKNKISIIEAGTGLGKTYAYLIPFIIASKKNKIPLIISTYTKSLQDQLFNKDLKTILDLMDISILGLLLKGRGNYICSNRLNYLEFNSKELVRNFECHDVAALILWSHYTESGDIEECSSFIPERNTKLWNLVRSDIQFCQKKCSNTKTCHYSHIIQHTKNADIIVVNHALLLSDAIESRKLLPNEHLFVVDEAHDLSKAGKDLLTLMFDKYSLNDSLSDILILIKKIFKNTNEEKMIEITQIIDSIKDDIERFFESYLDSKSMDNTENSNYPSTSTFNDIETEFQDCSPTLIELMDTLEILRNKFLSIDNASDNYPELKKNGIIDLTGQFIEKIDTLFQCIKSDNYISWMKFFHKTHTCSINYLFKDIGKILYEKYFKRNNIGLLCSATLTVNNSFNYFTSSVGLDRLEYERDIKKIILPSPFMLEEQLSFFSYKSELNINSSSYIDNISEQIFEISNYYNKRMLVLCTSYKQASQLKNRLKSKFSKKQKKILVHEKGRSKNALIRAYRNSESAVLIGTMAFWEGIDFPGEELSILMMLRIPFQNPNDPYVKYLNERLESIGKDGFRDYQVPNACLKMKQGFGRLIRTEYDSGIFIITDPRIYNSSYGHEIINSFPIESISYSHFSTILNNKKIL